MTASRDARGVSERLAAGLREMAETALRTAEAIGPELERAAAMVRETVARGGTLFFCGNGGSAADAQHVAAELVNRFQMDRDPLAAIALTTDTSVLTSWGNDVAFDQVFSRQVRALVQSGDVAVGISTSGNSPNVINGVIAAKEKGATTVGFTGRAGGELKDLVDVCCHVPSDNTARVQEAQIVIWHALCEVVEREIFGR